MKKLLTIAALVGITSLSFGQGQLNWNNTAGTLITVDGVSMPANNPVSTATTYNFGLFFAPAGTAAPTGINDPNWQTVAAYAANSTAAAGAGRFQNPGQATSLATLPELALPSLLWAGSHFRWCRLGCGQEWADRLWYVQSWKRGFLGWRRNSDSQCIRTRCWTSYRFQYRDRSGTHQHRFGWPRRSFVADVPPSQII